MSRQNQTTGSFVSLKLMILQKPASNGYIYCFNFQPPITTFPKLTKRANFFKNNYKIIIKAVLACSMAPVEAVETDL